MNKAKRNSKVSIAIIQSKNTKKNYLAMLIDSQPYKVWKLSDIGTAGIDFCNELMQSYDLGYDMEFQLPVVANGVRQIVPLIYNLNDSPDPEPEKEGVKKIVSKILAEPTIEIFDGICDNTLISDSCGVNEEFFKEAEQRELIEEPLRTDVSFVKTEEKEEPVQNETLESVQQTSIPEDVPVEPALSITPVPMPLSETITVAPQPIENKPEEPIITDVSNSSIVETETPVTINNPISPIEPVNCQPFVEETTHALEEWICHSCGISNSHKFCINCGTPKPAPVVTTPIPSEWICHACGILNSHKFCMNCGTPKPDVSSSNTAISTQKVIEDMLPPTIEPEPIISANSFLNTYKSKKI